MNAEYRWLGAAVLGLALSGAVAYADSPTPAGLEMQSLVLRTGDLDLNRPKDMARLYQRIVSAADRLCGPRSVGGMPGKSIDYVSCYDTAVSRAVERIDRPSVTAYFQQRSSELASRSLTALQ